MDKIEKDKIRKKELSKLKKIFKDIPKDKQKLAESLIQQAAFMVSTLDELQKILDNDGAVELFEQGSQRMLREHPAAKTYNAMIKNYSTICKQLFDLLPGDKQEADISEEEKKLLSFIKKGRK